MPNIDQAVEILRIMAWPSTVLLLAKLFKENIKALIDRVNSITAGPVAVTAGDQQKQAEFGDEKYKKLLKEVEGHKGIQKKLVELSDKIIQEKNVYFLAYHFEKTYRLIFGSQINLLNMIKNIPDKKMKKVLAEAVHRRTPLGRSYPFYDYTGFLINSYLISYNASDDTYVLTDLGFLFLEYIKNNNLPQNKPF